MSLDQMLQDSLRSVAGEVELGLEDRAHARHRIVHRREQRVARRRRVHGLVAAVTVGGLVLGGALGWRELSPDAQPAGPASAPVPQVVPVTVDALAGVWLAQDGSGSLWFFHHDGTVSWSEPILAGAEAPPDVAPVEYSLTDTGVDLPPDRCGWDLRITDDGRMTGTVTDPPQTGDERCAEDRWRSWVRLSPRSEAGADLVWTGSDGVSVNPRDVRWLHAPTAVGSVARIGRTWLQQGTGRMLVITSGDGSTAGRYVLDDGGELATNPDDVGTAVLDEDGDLVLTSSDESRGCPDGSVALFTGMLLRGTSGTYPPKIAPSLELVVEESECRLHLDLGGTWVQVSS